MNQNNNQSNNQCQTNATDAFYHSDPQAFYPSPSSQQVNGYAIAAMVLGILSLVLSCCCFVLIPVTGTLSIIFALVSRSKGSPMSGQAIAGLVCSIIALTAFLLIIFSVFATLSQLSPEEMQAYLNEYFSAYGAFPEIEGN